MKNLLVLFFSLLSIVSYSQCTTLYNNYTVNVPTNACSGTITNITVNSTLTIPLGKTLTITGYISGSGNIVVQGRLNTQADQSIDGAVRIDGGNWSTQNASGQMGLLFNSTVDVVNAGKIVCNGTFTNNDALNLGYNCQLTCIRNVNFAAVVSTVPTSLISIATSTTPNTYTTVWSGLEHYIVCKVMDYNAVTISSTNFYVDACKFRTGNFTYSGPANGLQPYSNGAYIEINGNASGVNAVTNNATIQIYRSGTGGNFGGATILGSAKSPTPC